MIKLIKTATIFNQADEVILTRYTLPLLNKVHLHFIYDDTPDFHSHKHSYISVILWGGYREELLIDGQVQTYDRRPGCFIKRGYSVLHRLKPLKRLAVTLFIRLEQGQPATMFLKDGELLSDVKYFRRYGYSRAAIKKMIRDFLQ